MTWVNHHTPFVLCKFQSTFMSLNQFDWPDTKWGGKFVLLHSKVGWKKIQDERLLALVSCFCDQTSWQGQLTGERAQFWLTVHGHSPSWWEGKAAGAWIAGYIDVMVKKQSTLDVMHSSLSLLYAYSPGSLTQETVLHTVKRGLPM